MNLKELVQWQWDGYVNYHLSRVNLLIHIIAVPLFILGAVSSLLALVNFNFGILIISILLMAVSIGVQGFGHAKEKLPAVPFSGPLNTLTRIFLEQLFTFPKFVISGRWYVALRNDSQHPSGS